MSQAFILTLSCADRPGIVHAVSAFLLEQGGNIEEAAQFNDPASGLFFMRVQFSSERAELPQLRERVLQLAQAFDMQWQLHPLHQKLRTVIFVSQQGHCLNDLLFRWKSGLLPIDVRAVVSNHRDFYQLVAGYDVPFHHIPVPRGGKAHAEQRQLEVIDAEGAELVVLARYMQILSDGMCQRLAGRAINIHHSFLPGFKGARPYHRAYERGVKLIGATAHYVTADLDEGPIIEQDVRRVDHAMPPEQLAAIGRDTETQVLARAVQWHAQHRVLLNGSRTVVFR